ncbi:protein FAM173B isoform B [Patagioenas fasciata monilis]|uniref:Protein FAM173B isoform B n=1 Tax=Patagioenas fasciata monilis TaxID=372326 RepID=A0A1V4JXW2_PATFA|nr:protein FAM173B isoform B [Patagioenas fasciata monilis]
MWRGQRTFLEAFGTISVPPAKRGVMAKVLANGSQAAGTQEDCEGSCRRKSWGLLATAGVGGTLVAIYAVATPFVTPALRKVCLPFVPATSTQIQNVLKMLENRSGSLVDIGSGDGRVVIAAAKRGFKAVGYELNPWLVWYSRYRAWRDGVHQSTRFYISDLWKVSFSHYTNVVVFGVPRMMPQLEKKLEEELESHKENFTSLDNFNILFLAALNINWLQSRRPQLYLCVGRAAARAAQSHS